MPTRLDVRTELKQKIITLSDYELQLLSAFLFGMESGKSLRTSKDSNLKASTCQPKENQNTTSSFIL